MSEEALKLLSKARLVKTLQREGVDKPRQTATQQLQQQEFIQTRQRIKFNRNRQFQIVGQKGTYQLDVVFLPQYRQENDGVTSFLFMVEVPTRLAYAQPLVSGNIADILKALQKMLARAKNKVITLTADNQFAAADFSSFCSDHDISLNTGIAKDDHISNHGDRLGIVDSAVRTVKVLISKYIDQTDDLEWTRYLSSIIGVYNDSPHSALSAVEPEQVSDKQIDQLQVPKYQANNKLYGRQSVKEGDIVRIHLGKEVFDKDSPKFSKALYSVKDRDGYRWRVTDSEGKVLRRRFRDYELQVVKGPVVKASAGTNQALAFAVHKQAQKLIRTAGVSTKEAYTRASKAQSKDNQVSTVEGPKRSGRTTRQVGKYKKLAS